MATAETKTRRKKTKPAGWRNRHLTDMRMFHAQTDWASLWEQWYLGIDEHGGPKYPTIRQFVKTVAKTEQQQRFMLWYLGPPDDEESEARKMYSYVRGGPVDWAQKRKDGGWFSEQNLVRFGAEIRRRLNALDALRECGNKVMLHSVVRAEQLAQKLDEEFGGRWFLPNVGWKDNTARARLYVSLHSQLLAMKEKAQELYAKAHGVNFDDMAGLASLYSAVAANASQIEGKPTQQQAAVSGLVEMIMTKAARFKLPLPGEAETVIVDAVGREQAKKKVQ